MTRQATSGGAVRERAPDIEVLICTHNRSVLLERTLASLNQARRCEGCKIGIVVVANACTDNTTSMLRSYQDACENNGWLPLRWIEEPTPGKSHALNQAVPAISSPVVAFVDDDHRVDRDYLSAICKAVQDYPDKILFCGRILPDWDGREPAWLHDQGPYRIYPLPVPRFDQGDSAKVLEPDSATPGGGDLFFRRDLVKRVGAFSTDLGPVKHNLRGAEDIEWVRRAISMGIALQYVPEVIQYHYVDPQRLKLSYLVRKAFERSASMVRLRAGNPNGGAVPLYMVRKIGHYLAAALFSLGASRRRFYLVRLGAAVGELKGFVQRRADRKRNSMGNEGDTGTGTTR